MNDRSPCEGQTLKNTNKPVVTDCKQDAFAIGNADASGPSGLD